MHIYYYTRSIVMKNLFFLFFYLVITTNASHNANNEIASPMYNTTKKACLFSYWTVFIYNGIQDPITVHVQSGDDDLGNHTLALNNNENWSFCEGATFGTLFYAHFYWNSKTVLFDVFDADTSEKYCAKWKFRKERRCFWLVREDGFYLGAQLNHFPEGWTKLHDW
ncbi:hypothetical protein L1987_49841 [Smallanthus sonchifolius]|uniref:Uncharacterized protein n=1 Tax=Smallanthus sonchifolius TaxID=185202 RepID=A0ACB9FWP6_9ASTR|nr:hypothetical protein L1987_49841 [Smallanthus sonchifolius]